jgi:hypothetical protein
MAKCAFRSFLVGLILISLASAAPAQTVCPQFSTCDITFNQVYTGGYMTGEQYDYVTIVPGGYGETFAGTGIDIQVCLKDCSGNPIVGMPAEEVVLFSSSLCICPGGNNADAPTDANGCTTFSGTISGGGTSQGLDVYADGVFICSLPVNVNSPDFASQASACFVDASDLSILLPVLSNTVPYDIAYDFDESGPPIDATDRAIFDSYFGASCDGAPTPTEAKSWSAIKAMFRE